MTTITLRPRQTSSPAENWWTTNSNGSTYLPSGPPPCSEQKSLSCPASSPSQTQTSTTPTTNSNSASTTNTFTNSNPNSGESSSTFLTTFTTSIPVSTFMSSSQTFTSYSQTVVTSATAEFSTQTPTIQGNSAGNSPVCIGDGLDSSSDGILAALIIPSAIGLLLWLLFAFIRPKFRQVYALREWFASQELRPKPLGSGLFAFLHPPVPLVPSVPNDVSDAGRSDVTDAKLFPSDEQLAQRALWLSFLIAFALSILGLGGALPLYLVDTPCLAKQPEQPVYGGYYGTIQDLSLLRLLRLVDSGQVDTTNGLSRRAVQDGNGVTKNAHVRIIVLTVLTLVLGVLPLMWKIIKEFNRAVAYRRRWVDVKCEGNELGWLSANRAPGFKGWGEKQLKEFIVKTGLSSSLETNNSRSKRRNRHPALQENENDQREEAHIQSEVDIQTLFTIGDTHQLALAIEERDQILEQLEIAETRYISSFRLTTPDPSIADFQPQQLENDADRPYISRPLPLGPSSRTKTKRRAVNPAFAASSLAPTSFVAPSQYYKLRGVSGVNGGKFAETPDGSLINVGRIASHGSRFLEINRNSSAYGRLPMGSRVKVEESGEIGPATPMLGTFPSGPNREFSYDEHGVRNPELPDSPEDENDMPTDGEWVDLPPDHYDSDFNGPRPSPTIAHRLRPQKEGKAERDTFPMRDSSGGDPPPPHLRLQPSQPFVRPLSGLDHNDLGVVYGDIRVWRSRLKAINAEIAAAQNAGYNDIADGLRIKGWLLVGKGLRHIPNIELIEGRSKEDIRWDVLQSERTLMDTIVLWAVILVVALLLAAGLTAASGLALATAPNFAHYMPFLQPLQDHNGLVSGLATVLAPAVGATLFIALALWIINWAANIRGSVSRTAGQLLVFKITFFILAAVASIWLIAVGSLLFALESFNSRTNTTKTIADGSVYISGLALALTLNVAIIFPALLLLRPLRLWRVVRAERNSLTPRQRFRAIYPRMYNPSFAMSACVLGVIFASTFSLIFPLIGPSVTILLLLTLVAHRYLVGYAYARNSQTGGLLQIWLIRRFGTLLSFQPLLLGLILMTRDFWIEGGILVGFAVAIVIFIESYAEWKTKLPGRKSLSAITRDSLDSFQKRAKPSKIEPENVDGTSLSTAHGTRTRGSMASVLEMMSLTLAVMPSTSVTRGPVPLQTEIGINDLIATERAARTHPDAPPHLPPLSFTDHAEEMSGILYAPELIAPPPIIWLPNDRAGVAKAEAVDLSRYHNLHVVLDVRAKEDVLPRRSMNSSVRS